MTTLKKVIKQTFDTLNSMSEEEFHKKLAEHRQTGQEYLEVADHILRSPPRGNIRSEVEIQKVLDQCEQAIQAGDETADEDLCPIKNGLCIECNINPILKWVLKQETWYNDVLGE